MSELQESYIAISNLNEDIFNQIGEYPSKVGLLTDANIIIIQFMDFELWRSDEDERQFFEDSGTYEPIEDYCRKQLNTELVKLLQLKF